MDIFTDQVEPTSTPAATSVASPHKQTPLARLRRSKLARLAMGLTVLISVVAVLAYGVLRVLGPANRFSDFSLPYVQDFTDVDPRKWFISDGIWSIREGVLTQVANLSRPASIYVPHQMAQDHPYHLSTYISITKPTQHAGVNFNAQYPDMTAQQHQVYIARLHKEFGQADGDETTPSPSMELVAGYTDDSGEFVKQISAPFDFEGEDFRLDLYVLGHTYTVQLNGQTLIDRRPLFFKNGLVGYYTLGPAKFGALKITTAETKDPGEQVYISAFDRQPAGAGWVPFSGEWEIVEGELVQANPAAQDAGIGYEGSAYEDYVVQVTFRHLVGTGGGLLFNMISPYQLIDAHVVRYSDQSDAVFWGYFDGQGIFVRQGFVDIAAPDANSRQLRVYVGNDSYDIYLEDRLLARNVPVQQRVDMVESGRSGGHIGLITSRSSAAYSTVEVFPLLGNTRLLQVNGQAGTSSNTAVADGTASGYPTVSNQTSGNQGADLLSAPRSTSAATSPGALSTATPLPENDRIIRSGAVAAWRSDFRGELDDAGWRPLSGQWRFNNGSLIQEDATGYDVAIAYTRNAFENFNLTSTFSHRDGNGGGVLFNMPYMDRLNGAHMVRYSDRRPGGIFWGYFDELGRFVGQGYANVSPPGDARHTLRVESKDATYSIYLDDFLLADDLPLRQNFGYVGFVTVLSSAGFEAAQIEGLRAPVLVDRIPIAVQQQTPAGIYHGSDGFPDQHIISGKWDVDRSAYRQTVPDVADYIFNTGLYASAYSIQSDIFFAAKPDIGGGFVLQMPERRRKAGATVVRVIKGGQGLFWGVYDESGAFRGRGSVELPMKDEGETSYRLKVEVRGNSMDILVDDALVIEGAVLPRAEGWMGLLAFGGPVTFGNIEITIGEGQ